MATGILILTLGAVALAFIYRFVDLLKYFEKRGVPHLKPTFLLGNMTPVFMKIRSISDQLKYIYDSFPDAKYVGLLDFTIPTIMLRDPEIIKYVTVKHFDNFVNHNSFVDEDLDPYFGKNLFGLRDDKWREMRSILSPSFTSSKIKSMFEVISKCGEKFADNLSSKVQEVELKDNFTRYTMDVIASAAFGISVDSIKEPNNEFYMMGRNAVNFDYIRTLKLFVYKIAPWLVKLFRIRIIPRAVTDFFSHIVAETVKSRENKGSTRNDMIQLMIEARNSGKIKNFSHTDMTAQAFIFFFGGFDTTSTAMSFAAYEIATNPEVQDKLQAEIDDALQSNDGKIDYQTFQELHYLEAVIYETLRKWPPAVVTDRVCNKEIEIPPALPGGRPFLAKPGTVFWLPYYGLHNDKRFFNNPEVFDPERFLDLASGKVREIEGYLPFGSGPRFCIGQRFAMMEVKLAILHLVMKCRLDFGSKTKVPIKLSKTSFTPVPENDFWVKVSPRTRK